MMKWFKRNQDSLESTSLPDSEPQDTLAQNIEPESSGFLSRFRRGLTKTRHQLGHGIDRLLRGKKQIDAELLEELETLLLGADFGIDATRAILARIQDGVNRAQLADSDALMQALKAHLYELLLPVAQPLLIETNHHTPFVILMIGVNGAGKTTTIGKLAKYYQKAGKTVMLAAGDTFRAAAVEQLQVWGARNEVPVIAQQTGADSASVIFDALQAARARRIDVLIADTAGRLHTQHNLMDELKKIKRVLHKLDIDAPHETLLVLDAGVGQNALNQARQFHDAIGLTGIAMTKLDGTAKGGIVFAIAHELAIPYRYVGMGEGIDDLQKFDARTFVDAIFDDDML